MPSPNFQSRDEVFRRLPDGTYKRVDGVVPRAELDKLLETLRKERAIRKQLEQSAHMRPSTAPEPAPVPASSLLRRLSHLLRWPR